jgi:hypothetical protein
MYDFLLNRIVNRRKRGRSGFGEAAGAVTGFILEHGAEMK